MLDNLCIVHLQYWSAQNIYYTIKVSSFNANFTVEMAQIFKKSVCNLYIWFACSSSSFVAIYFSGKNFGLITANVLLKYCG